MKVNLSGRYIKFRSVIKLSVSCVNSIVTGLFNLEQYRLEYHCVFESKFEWQIY